MPVVSQLQRKAMYAAAEGKSKIGIPDLKGLPARVKDGKPVKGKHAFGSLAP